MNLEPVRFRWLAWPLAKKMRLAMPLREYVSNHQVRGLAWEDGDHLNLLAIHSDDPGKGHVRDFLSACQARYRAISVWDVWNPLLSAALQRYGFQCVKETIAHPDGKRESLIGWRWVRPQKGDPA